MGIISLARAWLRSAGRPLAKENAGPGIREDAYADRSRNGEHSRVVFIDRLSRGRLFSSRASHEKSRSLLIEYGSPSH